MKRNVLSLLAVVVAIAFSSFSVRFIDTYYLVYKGTGAHDVMGSYNSPTLTQPTADPEADILYWVSVQDINGTANIQTAEFDAAFDVLDDDSDNTLDETEGGENFTIPGVGTGFAYLEKKEQP